MRAIFASEIPFRYIFRRDVRFPHAIGIVISEAAKIGRNVTIYQNVTLGGKVGGPHAGYPTVGDNVVIYTGAKVVGGVTLGDGCTVGANATVTKSVAPGAVVYSDAQLVER